jgi:hypothetical protein
MESYTRCLLRHKGTRLFIARSYDTSTRRMETSKTMKGALRFSDVSDASEWLLNAPTAPEDTDQYEYVTIRISIEEEVQYEQQYEHLRCVETGSGGSVEAH